MKWMVRIRDRVVEIPANASVVELSAGVYSVLLHGKSYLARVEGSGVRVDGHLIPVELVDPREMSAPATSGGAAGPAAIIAPMPGKVIRVLVEEGQEVEAGQGILIVEAMKMQNEMQSPKPGRVTSIQVKAGDSVAAGSVLAIVDPAREK